MVVYIIRILIFVLGFFVLYIVVIRVIRMMVLFFLVFLLKSYFLGYRVRGEWGFRKFLVYFILYRRKKNFREFRLFVFEKGILFVLKKRKNLLKCFFFDV